MTVTTISPTDHLSHPRYRADIDGLRAIAVLAVVAYHAFPQVLQGGFIGVDIFFVISGYLISTIVMGSLERNSFSFIEFYIRRINRIFPALLLVLVACFVFGWFALLSEEYKQLGKHIAGGAGFISNFMLWNESGYFDSAAETKPLLHLWSLGIEEQYYIIWPALLWMAWRAHNPGAMTGGTLSSWKKRFNLLTITITITAISFALNVIKVHEDVVAAFYAPQTRFWELMAGSILAYMSLHKQNLFSRIARQLDNGLALIGCVRPPEARSKAVRDTLSLLGAALIAIGLLIITKERHFPGWWAVLPTLGAVLIILAGAQAWFNRIVLSNRVLVWFGLISFPLYLWHWPLLSFARIMEGETPTAGIRAAAVILAIALAWLTYRLLERPIRFGQHGAAKSAILLLLMVIVGYAGFNCYKRDGMGFRKSIEEIERSTSDLIEPTKTRTSDGSCGTLLGLQEEANIVCLANSDRPDILIIGDSHAMSLNSAAYENKINLKTLLVSAHGCLPFEKISVLAGGNEIKQCKKLGALAVTLAHRYKSIHTVVLSTMGPMYFSGFRFGVQGKSQFSIRDKDENSELKQAELFANAYSELAAQLVALGKNVIFVIDVPELGRDPKDCIINRPVTFSEKHLWDCTVAKNVVLEREAIYRDMVNEVQQRNPQMKTFDSLDTFCDDSRCYGRDSGGLYYFDYDHINVYGSKKILIDLISRYPEIGLNGAK